MSRLEDPAALTGAVAFVDDLSAQGVAFAAIVRSTEPRANLRAIDVAAAAASPGVIEILTAGDLGTLNGPIPHPTWFPPNDALRSEIEVTARQEYLSVFASGHVRYVGEPIAVVVADDPGRAADAARLVFADYDARDVVTTIDQSMAAPPSALVNENWPDNIAARFRISKGDLDGIFASADHVVTSTAHFGRQTGTPIEPRGILADPNREIFTVWSSNQAPHWLQDALAEHLGLDHSAVRVVAPAVGGGFGIKSMVYPEDLLIPILALRLGRPVKWTEARTEHFLSAVHARDQHHEIELALDTGGTVLGLRDRYVADAGASNLEALIVPYNTAAHLMGCYRIPAVEIECICVLTNKAPLSAYRGAGRPEAVFAMERALDRAADALGMDRAELRRRNLLNGSEMPYEMGIPYRDGHRIKIDGGDFLGDFDAALRQVDYPAWRAEQTRHREEGRFTGIGFATYLEGTGIGPEEVATLRLDSTGRLAVEVALPSQGQGHATTLAQIAADETGLPIDRIDVRQGDTQLVPVGGGTIASRTAVVVGNAVAAAAHSFRSALLDAAAASLEVDPVDLRIEEDRVHVAGAERRSMTLAELASASKKAPVAATEGFEPEVVTFSSGTHIAVVEVHPATGHVDVLRYLVVHDCGRVINPLIVDGQVTGGVVQGIGGALSEELTYDEHGQLTTASFVDYQIPRATDVPNIEVHHSETASQRNPLGIRGVGEAGIIGASATIAGAIEDALRMHDISIDRTPMPPSYIAGLLEEAGA